MFLFQIWIEAKQIYLPASPHLIQGAFPLTMDFYYVFMYCYLTRTSEANSSETIHQPHQDTTTLGPGLNVCLCATCNATHTALILGLYLSVFLKLHADYPNGGGMCGSKLGHTSAVCMVTLMVPHNPDLIPRGHYAYCKGGAP